MSDVTLIVLFQNLGKDDFFAELSLQWYVIEYRTREKVSNNKGIEILIQVMSMTKIHRRNLFLKV